MFFLLTAIVYPRVALLADPPDDAGTLSFQNSGQVMVPLTGNGELDREITELSVTVGDEDLIPPGDWLVDQPRLLPEAEAIRTVVEATASEQLEHLGQEAYIRAVSKSRVGAKHNLGHGEVNSIDGHCFTRVVHDATKYSFVFLDRGLIERDSKHLRQYIARQHIDAGEVRRITPTNWREKVKAAFINGSRSGRDVVLVWQENGVTVETEYLPRFAPGSAEWWADYYYATVKKPGKGDLILGSVSTAAQLGMTQGLMWVKEIINPDYQWSAAPLVLSAAFGVALGVFNSTYRNWIYRGSDLSQTVKQWSVSLAYAYMLTIWEKGYATVIRIWDPQALLQSAHIWSNSWFHNLGRKSWYEFPRIRTGNRDNSETIKITWRGKKVDTEVSQASFEQQTIYLIPYTLKLAGLVGIGAGISLGVTTLDSGTLALVASIPAAQWAVAHYAEGKAYANAPDLRSRWERTKSILTGIPRALMVMLGSDPMAFDASVGVAGRVCQSVVASAARKLTGSSALAASSD